MNRQLLINKYKKEFIAQGMDPMKAQTEAEHKADQRSKYPIGRTIVEKGKSLYNKAKGPALDAIKSAGQNIYDNRYAIGDSLAKSVLANVQAPQSSYLEDKAKIKDEEAAMAAKTAQQNQQIANRNYRTVSAEDAASAGAAAYANTSAQLSGAAGAGAAALAGQQAGQQATNQTYNQELGANRQRSDERRDMSYTQRKNAADMRTMATNARQDASAMNTEAQNTRIQQMTSDQLSMGYDTNPFEVDATAVQAALEEKGMGDESNIPANTTNYYPLDLWNGLNVAAGSSQFYGSDTPARRQVAQIIAGDIAADPNLKKQYEQIVQQFRAQIFGTPDVSRKEADTLKNTDAYDTTGNVVSALTDPNNPTL